MHAVREVDCGSVSRQTSDFTAWSENIDLVREEVDLDALHELFGVAAVLHLHQLLQPFTGPIAIDATLILTRFVLPVCGDSRLSDAIHFFGANLHLNGHSIRTEERRVV